MPKSQKPLFNDKDILSKTKITIEKIDTSISIIAETPRLIIRPVKPEDVSFYQNQLWGNQQVMEKFADSHTRLYKDEDSKQKGMINYAQNRIVDAQDSWCTRWKNGNPWSGMTVIDKKSNNPIGHVVIGGGELAYFFIPEVWGQHIGSEAVTVLTKAILPSLVISGNAANLPEHIEATTRTDHIASQTVLSRAGLTSDRQINKRQFGDKEYERFIFKASVAELVHKYKDIKQEKIDRKKSKDPQFSLPLYRLRLSSQSKEADEMNIGGYSLRSTTERKKRYSY
jgi:RimJ/RimL family protein N-acetyltransferase